MKSGRYRHFDLIVYCTENELFSMLHKYNDRISRYAFAKHDKDTFDSTVYEDDGKTVKHNQGELKKEHRHLTISLYNACTCTAVKKMFTTPEDKPRVDSVNDLSAVFRYLVHLDNPEKYQYDYDSIISNDITYYESLEKRGQMRDTDQNAVEIVSLIRKGVNPWLIAQKYGREAIIHYRHYKDFADSISLWEVDHPKRGEPPKLCVIEDDEQIPFEID